MTKCIGILLLFLMMHVNHSHLLSCSVFWWMHSYERVQYYLQSICLCESNLENISNYHGCPGLYLDCNHSLKL